jgi:hypothetical protein
VVADLLQRVRVSGQPSLVGHTDDVASSVPGSDHPSARDGSSEGVATLSARSAPSDMEAETASRRRQVPISAQIELDVWRRAQRSGLFLTVFSGYLAIGAVAVTFVPAVGQLLERWMGIALWAMAVAGAIFSSFALGNRKAAPILDASTAPVQSRPPPEPWETLPEIVALRAGGKRYRLIGDLFVASPNFELATIFLWLTGIILTVSPYTSPFADLFHRFGVSK